jgi:transcriptional regulator with XRE-family HTH domain
VISKNELKKAVKAVGLKVRAIRNEKGLTLEEVEAKGYPSWRHLQKVEAGKNVTLETLLKLADSLECDIKEFFN